MTRNEQILQDESIELIVNLAGDIVIAGKDRDGLRTTRMVMAPEVAYALAARLLVAIDGLDPVGLSFTVKHGPQPTQVGALKSQ